ncbi:MAG: ABC transporter permease, partial [Pirellulaceae bacterium]|nr:ABC transporter permease [Pirellulaceae bacterium]
MSDQPLPPLSSSIAKSSSRARVHPAVRLWRLTRKELRETLRDRRTIITLVLMPLLVYPLLSVAFRQFFFSSYSKPTDLEWRIAGDSEQTLSAFAKQLEVGGRVVAEIDGPEKTPPKVAWFTDFMLEEALRIGKADLGVRANIVPSPDLPGGVQLQYEILYREDSALSRAVAEYAERRLWGWDRLSFADRLQQQKQNGGPHTVWKRSAIAGETGEVVSIATLVPLILILMTITGAVYPAIDLTAGERERGTLESLMAAPLPRLSMLLAKYFAVLTVALLTAGA